MSVKSIDFEKFLIFKMRPVIEIPNVCASNCVFLKEIKIIVIWTRKFFGEIYGKGEVLNRADFFYTVNSLVNVFGRKNEGP